MEAPANVILQDSDGLIRFEHVNSDYKTSLDADAILEASQESTTP